MKTKGDFGILVLIGFACSVALWLEILDKRMGKEMPVDASSHDDGKVEYKTPRWVQVWFLRRSRSNWKRKYMELKTDSKRLQNRVNDIGKSREKWRDETKELEKLVRKLQAENAALREQLAAEKKDGPFAGVGSLHG